MIIESYRGSEATTNTLVPFHPSSAQVANLGQIADRASAFIRQSKAANTVRAYESDWRDFERWCGAHGLPALPALPETVSLYISDLASTHKVATINRRVSAISQVHQMKQLETPTRAAGVRLVLAGIRRSKGTAQSAKTPVLVDDVKRMVGSLQEGILGVRDRALLLIGFTGAFRRSELVALDCEDLKFNRDGLVVTIRRSKTDQEAEGRKVGIPYGSNPETCPIRSVQHWLESSGILDGPVFRPVNRHRRISPARLSAAAVADIVKRYAAALGFDPAGFAGHSLRSGLATSAAMAGASERSIMKQTGHRSLTVVRRYIRDGSLFRENAAATVGL